jgi:hypothetical protein
MQVYFGIDKNINISKKFNFCLILVKKKLINKYILISDFLKFY